MGEERVAALLASLGIDQESFAAVVEWVLAERLVLELAHAPELAQILGRDDELRRFRDLVNHRTRREWSLDDIRRLLDRVKIELYPTARRPIPTEEALLLRLTAPLECVQCGASPPDVVLHMDHIVPASKGGNSRRENLQFLCQEHNLRKSNRRELGESWLDLA